MLWQFIPSSPTENNNYRITTESDLSFALVSFFFSRQLSHPDAALMQLGMLVNNCAVTQVAASAPAGRAPTRADLS